MAFNINDIRSQLTFGGARPSLFQVIISNPVNPVADLKLPFLCKVAEIPSSTLGLIEVPYFGRKLKMAGDRVFAPWTVTVINDANFTIRKFVERWMSLINNHEDNQGLNDGYFGTLKVHQLNRDGSDTRSYEFVEAWPSDLGPISVSYDNENQLEEYQITFQYQYWTTPDLIKG